MLKSPQIRTIWLDAPHCLSQDSALTLGSFDGIHLGHKKLLERLIISASQKSLSPMLLTFDPHPRLVLSHDILVLTTVAEREILLRQSGLTCIVHMRFTKEFAEMSAGEFVEKYLVESLDVKHLVVGYDHHFGKGRAGKPGGMLKLGEKFGFTVDIVPPVETGGIVVKSNLIRDFISSGRIDKANELLGHPYLVFGEVMPGRGIGTHIGFATANLEIPSFKQLPMDGVYAATASILPDASEKDAMVYVGRAPTFDLPKKMFEVHIFDHDGSQLYGKHIAVWIHKFIRSDITFKSTDELRQQIANDAKEVQRVLSDI